MKNLAFTLSLVFLFQLVVFSSCKLKEKQVVQLLKVAIHNLVLIILDRIRSLEIPCFL